MANMVYIPPAIIHSVQDAHPYGNPYFYEYNGKIINLAAAREFYVDHLPLTSLYWPSVKIGSCSYYLSPAMSTEAEAMEFLRQITEKISTSSNETFSK